VRWSVRRSARQIVHWSAVTDLDSGRLQLDVDALKTPAFDWERANFRCVKVLSLDGYICLCEP
jgi:hypothetical protein